MSEFRRIDTLRTVAILPVAVVVVLFSQCAWADTVCISDLTEGQPTVKVYTGGTISATACNTGGTDVTSARLTLFPDSDTEFLHFNLAGAVTAGLKLGANMYEQVTGELSDVLLYGANNTGLGGIDVSFCSDPVFCNPAGYTILTGGLLEPFEDGDFQYEGGLGNTGLGNSGYDFYIQSDTDTPEPGSLVLLGAGFAALGVLRRRRLS